MFVPEPLIVRQANPVRAYLRRDEAIAAFRAMPLHGHEAGIEPPQAAGDSVAGGLLLRRAFRRSAAESADKRAALRRDRC